jgi:multiple sugar transport system permease protein
MISGIASSRWRLTAIVFAITAVLLSPFYWVLMGSFNTPAELFGTHLTLWPKRLAVENWSNALVRLWPHVNNSLIVSTIVSSCTLALTVPAAYALVWLRPRGGKLLFNFLLVTQMLPAIVFVIPLFVVFSQINLVNSLFGLALGDMTFSVPFALIMLCAYVKDLPYELVEAALVDGATQFRSFIAIVIPLMLPGIITVGIFAFLIPWADLIYALSLVTDETLQPLTLQLYKALGQYGIDWSFLLPGSVLTSIPAVIFVIAASRFILSGVTRGAIK